MVTPDMKNYRNADGSSFTSAGFVTIPNFRFGHLNVANLTVRVADLEASCEPTFGLIGLDLFPTLGISVSGVPVNFPGSPDNDEQIADPSILSHAEFLDKHQVPEKLRQQLLDAIRHLLDANAAIPIGTFCTHPSAVVPVNTGDAAPVYTPQYRPSEAY
jgi:hypothetical protein